MTVFHVGATFLLTSLYTFITIFVCVFPWLGEDTIRTPPQCWKRRKKKENKTLRTLISLSKPKQNSWVCDYGLLYGLPCLLRSLLHAGMAD